MENFDPEKMSGRRYAKEAAGAPALYTGPFFGEVAREFECSNWSFLGVGQ